MSAARCRRRCAGSRCGRQCRCRGQRELRQSFAALGVNPEAAASWLEGPLAAVLLAAQTDLLQNQPPFMLMCQRGRLYLRMELERPDVVALAHAQRIHAVAARQAMRVAGRSAETADWSAGVAPASAAAVGAGRPG